MCGLGWWSVRIIIALFNSVLCCFLMARCCQQQTLPLSSLVAGMTLACEGDKVPYVLCLLQVKTCHRGVKSLTLLVAESEFYEAEGSWRMLRHSRTREESFQGHEDIWPLWCIIHQQLACSTSIVSHSVALTFRENYLLTQFCGTCS